MQATLSHIRVTPKKANLVAKLVRNKNVVEALNILKFTPKKTAPILSKLISSAAANAENNDKQTRDNLRIQSIMVGAGPTYKRSMPVSRGRSHPILKRTSNIKVQLEVIKESTSAKSTAEKPAKKTAKKPSKAKKSKQ